jgi:hypothetical protein
VVVCLANVHRTIGIESCTHPTSKLVGVVFVGFEFGNLGIRADQPPLRTSLAT